MAIILALAVNPPAFAVDDDIVRLKADGRFIDGAGKVIAHPNLGDPRNTADKKYYSYLNAAGMPNGNSDFFIVYDKFQGFKKIKLNGNKHSHDVKKQELNYAQPNGMVTNYNQRDTSIMLEKNPEIPIYDSLGDRRAYDN